MKRIVEWSKGACQKAEPVGDVHSPGSVEYIPEGFQQKSSALQREGYDAAANLLIFTSVRPRCQ